MNSVSESPVFWFALKVKYCLLLIIPFFFMLICPEVRSDDLKGAEDHPMLKRFEGSKIVGYDVKRFNEFQMQTSTYQSYDLSSRQRQFIEPPLKLEGRLTKLWYESAGDTSSAEIMRNYQNELVSQ